MIEQIREALWAGRSVPAEHAKRFFKTGPGEYAEHDRFIGVPVPAIRRIAKQFQYCSLDTVQQLLMSELNEERLLALMILIHQYQNGSRGQQEVFYHFYYEHKAQVNNWNLVDASAPSIVGAYLWDRDRSILLELASSASLWDRRIAIVATWYFIRKGDYTWTLQLADLLLKDKHDLMHKAVGWMLREVGKRDQEALMQFLDAHAPSMPRTMLRYAVERFPVSLRQQYLVRRIRS